MYHGGRWELSARAARKSANVWNAWHGQGSKSPTWMSSLISFSLRIWYHRHCQFFFLFQITYMMSSLITLSLSLARARSLSLSVSLSLSLSLTHTHTQCSAALLPSLASFFLFDSDFGSSSLRIWYHRHCNFFVFVPNYLCG